MTQEMTQEMWTIFPRIDNESETHQQLPILLYLLFSETNNTAKQQN